MNPFVIHIYRIHTSISSPSSIYRALVRIYRALLWIYSALLRIYRALLQLIRFFSGYTGLFIMNPFIIHIYRIHTSISSPSSIHISMSNSPSVYRALLRIHRALLRIYRALLWMYKVVDFLKTLQHSLHIGLTIHL